MITIRNDGRVVRRQVASEKHGALVLVLAEECIYYRQKGTRTAFLLPHGRAFQEAVELEVARRRAERSASRPSRRTRRRA